MLERKKDRLTTKALLKVKKQANLCCNGLGTTTGEKFKSELAHPIGLSQLDPPSTSITMIPLEKSGEAFSNWVNLVDPNLNFLFG